MNKKRRNITLAARSTCTACAACANACAHNAICFTSDNEGFNQPVINKDICVLCHKCEKVCPVLNAPEHSVGREIHGYAATHKDADVLSRSKSGGVFYALAKYVIEQNGVVFGVRWNVKELCAEHAYVETIDELKQFQGSKYVQSEVGESLKQAIKFTKEGRLVLFSGTPCQIAGLYSMCKNKKYDNLILVEVICHGVSNQNVFSEYMHWRYPKAVTFTGINMHDKKGGWRHPTIWSCSYIDKNSQNVNDESVTTECKYLLAHCTYDYILRRSCYNCTFRQPHNFADIVLADYWGVWEVTPEMFDNRGVSVILSMNQRGENIIHAIEKNFRIMQVPVADLLLNQPYATDNPSNIFRIKYRRWRFFILRRLVVRNIIDLKWCYKDDIITYISWLQSKFIRKIRKIWQKLKK